jgi:hypothetical protein
MEDKGPNIYIEFSILENSDKDTLKTEMEFLIKSGRLIFLWSKTVAIIDMVSWIVGNELQHYIWAYRVKDSMNYSGPDFVIDNDKAFVDRFKRSGIPGNVVDKL